MNLAVHDLIDQAICFRDKDARSAVLDLWATLPKGSLSADVEIILEALNRIGLNDHGGAIGLLDRASVLDVSRTLDSLQIRAALLLSTLRLRIGDHSGAQAVLDILHDHAATFTDVEKLSFHWCRANTLFAHRQYERAHADYEKALVFAVTASNTVCVARITIDVATTASMLGDTTRAISLFEQAVNPLQAIKQTNEVVRRMTELVSLLSDAERYAEAFAIQQRCATIQRSVYAQEIERTIELTAAQSKLDIERESIRQRDEERNKILHAVLPPHIAEQLMSGKTHIADRIDDVTILFVDIVGFTALAAQMDAESLVTFLEDLFSEFDAIAHRHGCERLKTIGDSYMAICGATGHAPDHTLRLVRAAVEIMHRSSDLPVRTNDLRIGIHRGPVVAGVMSGARLSYDVWGDTVNVAARMEQHATPGTIHCTDDVAITIRPYEEFDLVAREPIHIHGKGLMQTYTVQGREHKTA